jgi:rhodanese-related sulfurtransferase
MWDGRRYSRWPLVVTAAVITLMFIMPLRESARGDETKKAWQQDFAVMEPAAVAQMIRDGKSVVFVDVREPQEYHEFHIPSAASIPLRSVDDVNLGEMQAADLVVPYCLKDFRGFEGARTLRERGIEKVGVMKGFGITSWEKAGLPVAGEHSGLEDAEALQEVIDAVQEKKG